MNTIRHIYIYINTCAASYIPNSQQTFHQSSPHPNSQRCHPTKGWSLHWLRYFRLSQDIQHGFPDDFVIISVISHFSFEILSKLTWTYLRTLSPGWWFQTLWKKSSTGMMTFPTECKNHPEMFPSPPTRHISINYTVSGLEIHVPNHQPATICENMLDQ